MTEKKLRVEGHPQFVKVGHAVINDDKSAYEVWLAQQMQTKSLMDRIEKLETLVEKLLKEK